MKKIKKFGLSSLLVGAALTGFTITYAGDPEIPDVKKDKSARVTNCVDLNGNVYAYATDCETGNSYCVQTPCPNPPY